MRETGRRQAEGRRWAAALGFAGGLLVAAFPADEPRDALSDQATAMAEASDYLEGQPTRSSFDGQRWQVHSQGEHATLDAQTGDLLEIEFSVSD